MPPVRAVADGLLDESWDVSATDLEQEFRRAASQWTGDIDTKLRAASRPVEALYRLSETADGLVVEDVYITREARPTPGVGALLVAGDVSITFGTRAALAAIDSGWDGPARPSRLTQFGTLLAFAVIFAATPLFIASVAVGMAVVFLGCGVFAFTNYFAYRIGRDDYLLSPVMASRMLFVSLSFAIVSLVAGATF